MEKFKHVKYICTECGHGWLVKYVLDEDMMWYDVLHEKDTVCHKCGEIGVELDVANA